MSSISCTGVPRVQTSRRSNPRGDANMRCHHLRQTCTSASHSHVMPNLLIPPTRQKWNILRRTSSGSMSIVTRPVPMFVLGPEGCVGQKWRLPNEFEKGVPSGEREKMRWKWGKREQKRHRGGTARPFWGSSCAPVYWRGQQRVLPALWRRMCRVRCRMCRGWRKKVGSEASARMPYSSMSTLSPQNGGELQQAPARA